MKLKKSKELTKQATYDSWWNGDVTLVYATKVERAGEKPIVVDWSLFIAEDVIRIKQKQFEIFEEQVNKRLEAHKAHFLKTYNSSENKTKFYNDEKRQCDYLLFGKVSSSDFIRFKHWGVVYDRQYILDIQNYAERTIYQGIEDGFDFIHSPNCKFQDKNLIHSCIYARSVWEYLKWLKSLAKERKSQTITSTKNVTEEYWFIVGVAFAKGEIEQMRQEQISYTKMAVKLGNRSFRPYISETVSNGTKSNKNIFSRKDADIQSILSYCERNNIKVVDSFNKECKKGQKLRY